MYKRIREIFKVLLILRYKMLFLYRYDRVMFLNRVCDLF